MNARPDLQQSKAPLPDTQLEEVQRLALTGYDFDHATHLVLKVEQSSKARDFLAELLQEVTFSGDRRRSSHAVNIGFTYRGLEALGLSRQYLEVLEQTPAFQQGAPTRAARRLGDTGASAAERWEQIFAADCAHVLISVHGDDRDEINAVAADLVSRSKAQGAFECLDPHALEADHLTKDKQNRGVHFGYRDGIARPVIAGATSKGGEPLHSAGELLLGYENDEKFDLWSDATMPEAAAFFRNGSFAAVRKIQQDEEQFDHFLERNEKILKEHIREVFDAKNYLKAKLCGRWPNGAVMKPEDISEPAIPKEESVASLDDFRFKDDDPHGFGCPFGAHIRRTNPRDDPIVSPRRRPLFRRGMPYGVEYSNSTAGIERGLIGLFFCASLEDQFEHVMQEWIEKKPMGPRHRGTAKDPLAGHHDNLSDDFYIPHARNEPDIQLTGFTPFITTRGTLYAFFPSRTALKEIAGLTPTSKAAQSPVSKQKAEAPYPLPDRFCDVVMEGGVTSGIIYASAAAELKKHYRFKNIGGSSIGAFAAALTAAAEYSRRYSEAQAAGNAQSNARDGFEALAKLPDELAKEDWKRDTVLRRMFRPQKETQRLFEIFVATLGHEWKAMRVLCGLIATLWQYRLYAFGAALVTAVLAMGPFVLLWLGWFQLPVTGLHMQLVGVGSWGLALSLALAAAVVAAVLIGIVLDLRKLAHNGFGVCRGWSKGEEITELPDLAGYLHKAIQSAAGREIEDPPLTFKDLWNAPRSATGFLNYTGNEYAKRSINLEVYATNLAHGRPYRFPLEEADNMGRLFFKVEDMASYFPGPILNHLLAYGRPYCRQSTSDPDNISEPEKYLELPREHLPIAVAARLALSFPFLISAVPLFAIDYEQRDRQKRDLAECWISDGGLCSNFPIHLFDSFLPKWPTFGISLQTRSKYWEREDYPETVWLPDKHFEGAGDSWNRFVDSKGRLGQLKGFILSLWMATWHWNDMTMMRMPGVRDRVVRVLLEEGEGGVNIKMSGKQILNLAKNYGKPAADAFVEKFAKENSYGWPEHRWVRFNRLLISLREQIECFGFAAELTKHALPLEEQIEQSRLRAPLRGREATRGVMSQKAVNGESIASEQLAHEQITIEKVQASERPLSGPEEKELKHLLASLATLESMFGKAGDNKPYVAVPRPSLRVRHPT